MIVQDALLILRGAFDAYDRRWAQAIVAHRFRQSFLGWCKPSVGPLRLGHTYHEMPLLKLPSMAIDCNEWQLKGLKIELIFIGSLMDINNH